jgi:hypothetical protein
VRESHVPSSNEPRGSQSQAGTHPWNVKEMCGTTYTDHTKHINLAKYLHQTITLFSQSSTPLSFTTWFKTFKEISMYINAYVLTNIHGFKLVSMSTNNTIPGQYFKCLKKYYTYKGI